MAYRANCSVACEHADVACRDMGEAQPGDNISSRMLDANANSEAGHHRAAECDVSRLADVSEEGHSRAPQEASPGTIP